MGLKEKIASWIYQHLNADKLIADKGGIKLYKEVVKDAYGNICETLRSFKGLTPFKTIEKTTTDIRRPSNIDYQHTRDEKLRIKVLYSRLRRSINHSNKKKFMHHHVAEGILRMQLSDVELIDYLKKYIKF